MPYLRKIFVTKEKAAPPLLDRDAEMRILGRV